MVADPFLYAFDLGDPPEPAWHAMARPEQRPPEEPWSVMFVRGGRGSGKTWTGGNMLADQIRRAGAAPSGTEQQWAVIGPTVKAARDVCMEGESGLLAALGLPLTFRGWNRSLAACELILPDGNHVFVDGANDGAPRIQGKNLLGLWADEPGLWTRWETAWLESVRFAVRKGTRPPKRIITGTPKRGHPFVKMLIHGDKNRKPPLPPADVQRRLSTKSNLENLNPEFVREVYAEFDGTSLGAQELEGELLDEAEGALWTSDPELAKAKGKGLIVHRAPPTYQWRGSGGLLLTMPDFITHVVAVDPAVSSGPAADEWGIIVGARDRDRKVCIRDDRSARCSPQEAAERIVEAYDAYEANLVVYEANQGGDLVKAVIDQVRPGLPVKAVHAKQGKYLRAEPVQLAYQRGEVYHESEERLAVLESQMIGWEPNAGMPSPDRLDAMVHLVTELLASSGEVTSFSRGSW